MLGLLVVGILVVGGSPGYAQGPDPGTIPAVPAVNGIGPEVVPIETRAWAHDDFGRVVFDWPWAVAYGARIEGKTLTVMFDRRLHTTFQRIPRYLGAYITDVSLGPAGQSVVASLTDEYRLRTFLLNDEDGGVKVVVDLLADGGAEPVLAQAPALPSAEPSPEAVPGDNLSPTISGDSPSRHQRPSRQTPLPLLPFQPPTPLLPPSLPFAAGTDPEPEDVPESSPPIGVRASSPQAAKMAALPGSGRGEEEVTPPVKADEDTPPTEPDSSPESVPTAEATPPVEEATAPESGENLPRPSATPPRRGSEEAASPVKAEADMPPTESDSTPESAQTTEAPPPVEEIATPESGENPPRPPATPPERGAEEASPAVQADADAPPAEPTPETVSEETPQTETATSPHPDPLPEGEGESVASTPDAPSEETAAVIEDTSSTETAETAATTPESPTPSPQLLTLPVSQSQLFRLDTPVASVFVADPDIADVQLVSSGVLFVVAKAVGRTSVAALDADSELVGEWTISTVLDIQPVRAALEGVTALKNVAVRQLNRGVELSGTVASIAVADLALRLTTTALPEETPVENRISVTGKQQINLEVQIAEVQRNVSETLGFNWEVLPDIGSGRDLGFRVGRTFLDDAGKYIVHSLPGGSAAALAGSTGISPGRTTVRGLIDALATAGLATVLARPNVTAVSGETASFFSGGEYPLPAGFEDGAIIFEYKKYGVLLDFVPTIIDNGRIMLTVRPEVSERSDTDSLKVTGIDIPVINVRRAETTVEVGDGESIVIAGLYRDQSESVEAGLPVVKDIPLLGMLFGTQSVRSNATELIVVVTARLTTATVMPRTTDRDRQLPGRRLRGYHY